MSNRPVVSAFIVVIFPPYLNNFDFAEMTRMLLYFWGIASSWAQITDKVRRKLVVNTTTALGGQKGMQYQHKEAVPSALHGSLNELVRMLSRERKHRAG